MTLVDISYEIGYKFISTTNNGKIISINNQSNLVEVLHFIEFSSSRKRSTIVIMDDNKIKVFTKGADNIIIGLLS